MIGLGYYGTITPSVIRRNVLESPAWYTAYTPYQPEISQGRLEALLNFQTMVADLTALPTAGASLLDEATAVAEAMTLARREYQDRDVCCCSTPTPCHRRSGWSAPGQPPSASRSWSPTDRCSRRWTRSTPSPCWCRLPAPVDGWLERSELAAVAERAHAQGALVVAACDLLALTLTTPPGEWGADVAVGSSQRFGVPLFYGGPHAGFIAVRSGLERTLPGRLVGVSKDVDGTAAFRLALQTREQHIRREKATSNICTAQVLLAVTASMYAVYHGPEGLRAIADELHNRARVLAGDLREAGIEIAHSLLLRHRDRGRAWSGRRRGRRGPRRRGPPAPGRR